MSMLSMVDMSMVDMSMLGMLGQLSMLGHEHAEHGDMSMLRLTRSQIQTLHEQKSSLQTAAGLEWQALHGM